MGLHRTLNAGIKDELRKILVKMDFLVENFFTNQNGQYPLVHMIDLLAFRKKKSVFSNTFWTVISREDNHQNIKKKVLEKN